MALIELTALVFVQISPEPVYKREDPTVQVLGSRIPATIPRPMQEHSGVLIGSPQLPAALDIPAPKEAYVTAGGPVSEVTWHRGNPSLPPPPRSSRPMPPPPVPHIASPTASAVQPQRASVPPRTSHPMPPPPVPHIASPTASAVQPQRASVPYVSQFSGEEVSMTLPPKEYGAASTTIVSANSGETVTVLPPIEYSEYKRREKQGQQYEVCFPGPAKQCLESAGP